MVNINFRADEQLKADLLTLAKADKRDLSSFLNKVLSDYIEGLSPIKHVKVKYDSAAKPSLTFPEDDKPIESESLSPQMRQYMKKPSKKR